MTTWQPLGRASKPQLPSASVYAWLLKAGRLARRMSCLLISGAPLGVYILWQHDLGCPGPQAPSNPLIHGADVEIIGGNYKGSRGQQGTVS